VVAVRWQAIVEAWRFKDVTNLADPRPWKSASDHVSTSAGVPNEDFEFTVQGFAHFSIYSANHKSSHKQPLSRDLLVQAP
jgi:hypothetical protein